MLGESDRAAWLIRLGASPGYIEHRMLRMTSEDLAPGADRQSLPIHAVVASTTPAASAP